MEDIIYFIFKNMSETVVIIIIGGILFITMVILFLAKANKLENENEDIGKPLKFNQDPINMTFEKWEAHFDRKYQVRSDNPVKTTLSGVNYGDCEKLIKYYVNIGDKLMLIPDPDNKHDKTATRVCIKQGRQIGWLPNKDWNDRIFYDLMNKKRWDADVIEKILPDEKFNCHNVVIRLWEYSEVPKPGATATGQELPQT